MSADPNPYQSPQVATSEAASNLKPRSNVAFSLVMILGGSFFCVTSLYVVFDHGITAAIGSYELHGPFSFAFIVFYGVTGGFTATFHLSYLIRRWPAQKMAGMYAIGLGLTVALASLLIMNLIV